MSIQSNPLGAPPKAGLWRRGFIKDVLKKFAGSLKCELQDRKDCSPSKPPKHNSSQPPSLPPQTSKNNTTPPTPSTDISTTQDATSAPSPPAETAHPQITPPQPTTTLQTSPPYTPPSETIPTGDTVLHSAVNVPTSTRSTDSSDTTSSPIASSITPTAPYLKAPKPVDSHPDPSNPVLSFSPTETISTSVPTSGVPTIAGAAKKSDVGAIAGGIVGGLIFLLLALLGLCLYMRRRRNRVPPSAEFLGRNAMFEKVPSFVQISYRNHPEHIPPSVPDSDPFADIHRRSPSLISDPFVDSVYNSPSGPPSAADCSPVIFAPRFPFSGRSTDPFAA